MTVHHLVVYCDAGTAPGNPGPTGIGVHGYIYKERESKSYSGHTTHSPTKEGYKEKVVFTRSGLDYKDTEVEIIEYVDLAEPIGPFLTNQYGEVTAMIRAFEIAKEKKVKSVLAISDSKYAVQGINDWVKGWIKRGWVTSQGTPVANRDVFEKLSKLKDELEADGVKVEAVWIKGHAGHPGNTEADCYATIARSRIVKGRTDPIRVDTDAKGYWKNETDRHPFLHHVNLYLPVLSKALTGGLLFTGTHGKEDDEVGMRATESSFALIELDEVDEAFELIVEEIRHEMKRRNVDIDPFMRIRLAALYNGRFNEQFRRFGVDAMQCTSYRTLDFSSILTEEPVVVQSDPAFLAYQLVDDLEYLENIYRMYKNEDKSLLINDITDYLYETTLKGKTPQTKLKDTFTTSSRRLSLPVDYLAGKDDKRSAWIALLFGIGMPGRNQFKRFEALEPKVEVVTWKVGEGVFRYAVVIHVKGGKGIWSNIYSNYRFTKLDEQADRPFVEYEDGQQATI